MFHVVEFLWLALVVYWLIGAAKTKPAKQTERGWPLLRTALTVVISIFLFSPTFRVGWLESRFVPYSTTIINLGVAITALGIGLAIWARHVLGQNWSAAVSLKHSHELIQSGPYARIRHPIYSGVLLGLLGTALVIGKWRGLVAVAVLFASWLFKARKEEALLATEFGPAFVEHCSRTGMFLPRFR